HEPRPGPLEGAKPLLSRHCRSDGRSVGRACAGDGSMTGLSSAFNKLCRGLAARRRLDHPWLHSGLLLKNPLLQGETSDGVTGCFGRLEAIMSHDACPKCGL